MSSGLHFPATSPPDTRPTRRAVAGTSGPLLRLGELDAEVAEQLKHHTDGEDSLPSWSEEDVVLLHWLLLKQVQRLDDLETPLADKLATLNWIFTDPDKDALPFSFVNCVRVVSCSPLSPLPFIGDFDVSDLRERIAYAARRWIRESVERFPPWVGESLRRNPEWLLAKLERNPQYLNEQIRDRVRNGDLFPMSGSQT